MTLVGEYSICSICGKWKVVATDRKKVLEKQSRIDIYLEREDCARIPLWGKKIKNKGYSI